MTPRPLTHTERQALLAECFATDCGWPALPADRHPTWTRGRYCDSHLAQLVAEDRVRRS